MEANFKRCLAFVLECEGGWSDSPKDPGGATMKGITLKNYATWCEHNGRRAPNKDTLKKIKDEDVAAFYKSEYWRYAKCGELPIGLDLVVFDAAVNMGCHAAAKLLQQALGVKPDGIIGPITIETAKAEPEIIERFTDLRIERYRMLPGFDVFGHGWVNRAERAEIEANKLLVVK